MEGAFKEMADEGVPAASQPTEVSKPHKEEQQLPELSAQDFRIYNRMAEHMDMFHENFRRSWKTLYTACTNNKRPPGTSIRQFISLADDFCHHLTVHHTIEEQHIFPLLAKRMPAFRKELDLLTHHKRIHEGLDKLQVWLAECRSGERELQLREMKGLLDGFGAVLWEHLDAEVEELRAENMRLYWSKQEMARLPM
ncbi:hypothetical protein MBLNU230_g1729t1 [Neophaeotheca triangularis]